MRRALALAAAVLLPLAAHAAGGHPDAARLEKLRQAEVVIVTGSADHMEQVMRRAKVNIVVVSPAELPDLPLHGQQVLMVNCTGEMSASARERVRRFVTAGGFLYTTDHAAHYLLESAFPGFVKWNGQTSEEAIFPMQVAGDRGLLSKIGGAGEPRWQLASGGHLFDLVDKEHVDVLMKSAAVARKYHGSGVLGVRFRVGDGQVIHVTGHFYTQPGQAGDVAAAGRAFEQLSENVVTEKSADKARIDGLYDRAPRRAAVLQASPEPAAEAVAGPGGGSVSTSRETKVRVLGRKGDKVQIRDAEGNEGWVDADAL